MRKSGKTRKCVECETLCYGTRCTIHAREYEKKMSLVNRGTKLSNEDYLRFLDVTCFAKQGPRKNKEKQSVLN